jgi:hypothetical protein
MKKALDEKKLDMINDEEKIEYNIEVSNYDMTSVFIESEEELTAKMIKYIERQIRNSYEYRQYTQYLRNELDLTQCALLSNIDTKEINVSLEFHHFPLSLFDITETVAKSMLKYAAGKSVSTMDIAETVVGEHYRNTIGLVPLTVTLHEMAHNNAIVIPMNKINGQYREFIREYGLFLSDEKLEKVNVIEVYNNREDALAYNKEKLRKRIVNYNIEYVQEGDEGDVQET